MREIVGYTTIVSPSTATLFHKNALIPRCREAGVTIHDIPQARQHFNYAAMVQD